MVSGRAVLRMEVRRTFGVWRKVDDVRKRRVVILYNEGSLILRRAESELVSLAFKAIEEGCVQVPVLGVDDGEVRVVAFEGGD